MCGVFAQLGRNIDVMGPLRLMSHRGIRQRTYEGPKGSMGHVRLPIVGVDSGNDQPIRFNKWVLGFVGEVLDFRETNPGMACDVELVQKLWMERGPRALIDRDGFWALAVIDTIDGSLHVVCDYLAQKPMYFRVDTKCAGSELTAVASTGPTTLDEVYLSSCIKWGYCPDTRRTPYREVRHVLPGEHVVIKSDGQVFREQVDRLEPVSVTDPNEIRVELMAAAKRRVLSSDVPVACLVSGGLDSSITYKLANRYGTATPISYTAQFDPEEHRALEDLTGGYAELIPREQYLPNAEVLEIMQEPIDLGSLVPQIHLSRTIKSSVCLTGDGADELFGGYDRARRYDSQASDVWQELVAWHLPRLDRVMMRRTIELRTPFLARRVVQMALGLRWEQRNDGKSILKNLFRDMLPQSVIDLPKIPLRTVEVARDREAVSKVMVEEFRRMHECTA